MVKTLYMVGITSDQRHHLIWTHLTCWMLQLLIRWYRYADKVVDDVLKKLSKLYIIVQKCTCLKDGVVCITFVRAGWNRQCLNLCYNKHSITSIRMLLF